MLPIRPGLAEPLSLSTENVLGLQWLQGGMLSGAENLGETQNEKAVTYIPQVAFSF